MIRRATVAVSGLCLSAAALAGPPAKYYQDDTAAMVQVNIASITMDNVKAALNALITQADLDAAGVEYNIEQELMPMINQLGMVQMMTMSLTQNGANQISVAVRPPAGDGMGGEPKVNILMPANSEQGAQSILGFIQGMAGPAGAGGSVEVDGESHWVVLTPPGGEVEGDGSAKVRTALDGALSSVGENTLSIGMMPNEEMVGTMLERIDDEQGKQMVSTMMKADWMGMWLSVDKTPELGVRMKYANAELAGQVEELYQGAMASMVGQAQELDGAAEGAPEDVTPSAIAKQLSGWLSMEREGGVCTIKLDPAEMRELTLLAIKAGPMLQQNPMFGEFMREFQANMPPMN